MEQTNYSSISLYNNLYYLNIFKDNCLHIMHFLDNSYSYKQNLYNAIFGIDSLIHNCIDIGVVLCPSEVRSSEELVTKVSVQSLVSNNTNLTLYNTYSILAKHLHQLTPVKPYQLDNLNKLIELNTNSINNQAIQLIDLLTTLVNVNIDKDIYLDYHSFLEYSCNVISDYLDINDQILSNQIDYPKFLYFQCIRACSQLEFTRGAIDTKYIDLSSQANLIASNLSKNSTDANMVYEYSKQAKEFYYNLINQCLSKQAKCIYPLISLDSFLRTNCKLNRVSKILCN